MKTLGIHHISAICSSARRNYEFYANLLGLRLVKQTVNYDDPHSSHLYYGDGIGSPGGLITFFPHEHARQGYIGPTQVGAIAFAVPAGSLAFWANRLEKQGISSQRTDEDGFRSLRFSDHDGLHLSLVETDQTAPGTQWSHPDITAENAIQGFHHAELWVKASAPTLEFLQTGLGGTITEQGVQFDPAAMGNLIRVQELPDRPHGLGGAGTVHHIAFRAADRPQLEAWQRQVAENGLRVTSVQDRTYFESIYFREPGGTLFEIATDGPGFLVDESWEELGSTLSLPIWLESQRSAIEKTIERFGKTKVEQS